MNKEINDINVFTTLLSNIIGIPINYIDNEKGISSFIESSSGPRSITKYSREFFIKFLKEPKDQRKVYRVSIAHIEAVICDLCEHNITFILSPFLKKPITKALFQAVVEKYDLDKKEEEELKLYYSKLSLLDEVKIENMCKLIFFNYYGTTAFEEEDLIIKEEASLQVNNDFKGNIDKTSSYNIETMYENENEYVAAISSGNSDLLKKVTKAMSIGKSFMPRSADKLRDAKNYGIIFNTISRKAAESGAVHPFYIDSVSTELAIKIEHAKNESEVHNIIKSIPMTYCDIVASKSLRQYSQLIRNTINYIDINLKENLTLNYIAAKMCVNPNYLSSKFNKEVKQSIASYLNEARIKESLHLLKISNISVAEVAEEVGFNDVNYFSKVFKKVMGVSPTDYRKGLRK